MPTVPTLPSPNPQSDPPLMWFCAINSGTIALHMSWITRFKI